MFSKASKALFLTALYGLCGVLFPKTLGARVHSPDGHSLCVLVEPADDQSREGGPWESVWSVGGSSFMGSRLGLQRAVPAWTPRHVFISLDHCGASRAPPR